jgi:DnaJ-class molecular chaperone
MPVTTDQSKRDYYEVLGVDRAATRDQIKHAYPQPALKYHQKSGWPDQIS